MKPYGRKEKRRSYPSKFNMKNHQNCGTCYPTDIDKKRERREAREEIEEEYLESTVEVTSRI